MSLFSDLFKTGKITDDMEQAKKLNQFMQNMNSTMLYEWTRRVNGDGTYVGYKTLRNFYKGRQWSYKKEGNGTMRTYNYCFTIVENMTAFLTNEPPQMSCPPQDVTDPLSRALAEGKTKLLREIHEQNQLGLQFQKGARTASMLGDAFIFGPFPEFETKEEETTDLQDLGEDGLPKVKLNVTKTLKKITYYNVENPATIRVIWKDDNYSEMFGFTQQYRLSIEVAKRIFASELLEAKATVVEDNINEVTLNDDGFGNSTNTPMTTIKALWLENEWLLTINNGNTILKYIKHDWGFLPLQYIPNIHLPGEPRGTSDLENELDPQQEYNERASDLADIIKELAHPTYWGKNLDNITEIRTGQTVIYSVGDDTEINAMPKSGQTNPSEQYIADRKNDIVQLSGMNNVLYPGNQVLQATGRALSVVMQGVNNKISLRKEWWSEAFRQLNRKIFILAEKYIEDADKLIGGYYKTDVFISAVLLRSVSDEINKFNARLQSMTTTQQNIGIPNPSEEQKLIKQELEDELLGTEISKQPGLLHEILAARMAAAQGQPQPGAGDAMSGGSGAGAGAMPGIAADESNNAPGENPIPSPGQASPVSSKGAAALLASRRGAARQVPSK